MNQCEVTSKARWGYLHSASCSCRKWAWGAKDLNHKGLLHFKKGTAPTDTQDTPVELFAWPVTPQHNPSARWAVTDGSAQWRHLRRVAEHPRLPRTPSFSPDVLSSQWPPYHHLQLASSSSFTLSQTGQDKRGGQKLATKEGRYHGQSLRHNFLDLKELRLVRFSTLLREKALLLFKHLPLFS